MIFILFVVVFGGLFYLCGNYTYNSKKKVDAFKQVENLLLNTMDEIK